MYKVLLILQYFLAAFVIIPTAAETVPSFVQEPQNPKNVAEGDNITLSWSYNIDEPHQQAQLKKIGAGNSQEVIVNRFANMNPIITNDFKDRFHVQIISDTQSSVTITGIQRSDSGVYEYSITDKNFMVGTSNVEISVLYKPNITSFITGNLTVNESDTLNLTCIADGNPEPSIAWIRLSDERPVHSPLTITGKQDEGKYRCVATNGVGNPDSRNVYIFVQNHHPIDTKVITNLSDNTVIVNTTFSVTCNATARPSAKYRFYRGTEVITDTDSDGAITTSVNERVKKVNYSCVPYNFYGDGSTGAVTVTIQYAPVDTNFTTENTTVLRRSHLTLKCSTVASPKAQFHLYSNGSLKETNNSGTFYVIAVSDAEYSCVPQNSIGEGENATVKVTVVDAPSVSVSPLEVTVKDNATLNLTCTVFGKPKPSMRWSKDGSSDVPCNDSLCTVTVSRQDALNGMIQYQCTASNGVGTPATATASITLHYAAMISEPGNVTLNVTVGEKVVISCNGTGNPKPTVRLEPFPDEGSNRKDVLEGYSFEAKLDGPVRFLCTVENTLAKNFKWFHLVLNAMEFKITLTINNKACIDSPGEVIKQLGELVIEVLKKWNMPVVNITRITYRCGSVKVYFSLTFSQNVVIANVLTVLKKASAEERSFGDLKVDPDSIQAIPPERIPTTPTLTTTPVGTTTEEHTSVIVVVIVVTVALVFMTSPIIIYCLYKRRKSRKDYSVQSGISKERPRNDIEMGNLDPRQGEEGAAMMQDGAIADMSKKKDTKRKTRSLAGHQLFKIIVQL